MAKRKISYDLFGKLQLATIEREVEDAYNGGISLFFADSPIEHPFNCDGFLSEGLMLRLIIEYKFDEQLTNAVARSRVLVQVLFYLKRFEEGGLPLPNVIMVGDKNECFVIHSNDVIDYLDEAIDWSVAPSDAADTNPGLVGKIAGNSEINPFVFKIEPGFDISRIIDRVRDLAVNIKRYVRVTEHNIAEIFDNFSSSVLRFPSRIDSHKMVEVFLGILLNPMDYFQHPENRNILMARSERIPIYGDAYRAFFDYYNKSYTPQEKMKFTEIADRLIEDVTRRKNGEFFTPVSFVDYAHRMLESRLGAQWKDEYVVWDCAAGTKNLTRDYRFRELYCSTLNKEDLDLSSSYNREACSFVFDFLNADLDLLPAALLSKLRANAPFVFFINPPWGTANNMGTSGTSKQGMAKTVVNEEMLSDGIGAASQNLYAQFLYRIVRIVERYNLTNCHIALFSPVLYLSGPSWKGFRERFLDTFSFDRGVQFKASHFADVKDRWGASFTIWHCGRQSERNSFEFKLIDRTTEGIGSIGELTVYNMDGRKGANTWAREAVSRLRACDGPQFSSAITIKQSGRGRIVPGALGYFASNSNNVDMNAQFVSIFSGAGSRGNGYSVTAENFERCVTLFAARRLVDCNWLNWADEYMVPNEGHHLWNEYVGDSIVFSLFESKSCQSSLRNVTYKGNLYDIHNEFFFMPREEMMNLANENDNNDCYQDARVDSDRFVYKLLHNASLSSEANKVIQKARTLVSSSFAFRRLFDMEFPEYQINNWDCGWYQIKALLRKYAPRDLAEFDKLFKTLASKMRPMVYEFGFLNKNSIYN